MSLTNTFSELNLLVQSSPRLSLTPRRRIFASSGAVAIAASAVTPVVANAPFLDVLTPNDGIIFDYLFGSYTSGGNAFPITTTFTQMTFCIAGVGLGLIIDLGSPTFTTLSVFGRLSLIFTPLPYFSALDINGIMQRINPAQSIFTPGAQPLSLNLNLAVGNTAATAQGTGTTTIGAFYRVVHSLEEG